MSAASRTSTSIRRTRSWSWLNPRWQRGSNETADGGRGGGDSPVRQSDGPAVRSGFPDLAAPTDAAHTGALSALQGGDARERASAGRDRAARAAGGVGDAFVPRGRHLRPAGQREIGRAHV